MKFPSHAYQKAYYQYKQQTMIKLITGRTKAIGEIEWKILENSGSIHQKIIQILTQQ